MEFYLPNLDFGGLDLSGLDLSQFDFSGITPAMIEEAVAAQPVAEPVYAPEPVYYAPEPAYTAPVVSIPGLGNIDVAQIMASLPPETLAQIEAVAPQAVAEPVAGPQVTGIGALPVAADMDVVPEEGRFRGLEGGDVYIDGIGNVPIEALTNTAPTTPNYLVRPTAGLDPASIALQELNGIRGLQFVTNKGNPGGITAKEVGEKGASGEANPSGFVPLFENATYRITNEKGTDQILYTGTGEEGLRNVYAIAQNLSATKGKKANWGVEVLMPGAESWRRVADDDPAKGFVKGALDVLGDAALGLVIGGPVGAAVAAGLSVAGVNVSDIAYPVIGSAFLGPVGGAMAGSAVSSAIQGRSLEETLMRAGLSGATAGLIETIPGASEALGSVAQAVGLSDAIAQGFIPEISSAISSVPASAAGEIVVTGIGQQAIADALASAAAGSALSSQLAAQYPDLMGGTASAPAPQAPETSLPTEVSGIGNEIVVTGAGQQAIADAAAAATGATTGQLAGIGDITAAAEAQAQAEAEARRQAELQQQFDQALTQPEAPVQDIVVTARPDVVRKLVEDMIATGGGSIGSALYQNATQQELAEAQRQYDQQREIVVPGQTTPTTPVTPGAGIGGATSGAVPETVGTEEIVAEGQKETPTPPPSDVIKDATKVNEEAKTDAGKETDDGKGLTTKDYIRMALAAPQLLSGIGGLLGSGESNDRIVRGSSPLNYTPLTRTQTGATTPGGIGRPGFDVFTYGQDLPGAQRGEYQFFQPYSMTAAPQTSTQTTTVPIYTQADVDAANAAKMNQYQTGLTNFNAYQDTLASQVQSGAITPEAAQAAAAQYAASLGYTAQAPAMAEGGEVDDEIVRHLTEYQKGGGHQGPGRVKGIGSGQEDLIPAWLSDGEYVWSAQDVADLGDGSTDEGVRRLDKMREMVRRNAGRKNVKNIAKPQKNVDKMIKAVGGPV